LQGLVVGNGLSVTTAADLDETKVVGFLGIFIGETTRENTSHLVREHGADLLEQTWGRLVAAIFSEEDGKRVVLVCIDKLVVSCTLEGLFTTPLVGVDTEEVNVSNVTTLEVRSQRGTETEVISVGITNRDVTGNVVGQVSFHVTDNSLNIVGGGLCRGGVEDDFVTSQESQGVVVAGENFYDRENVLKVLWGVGGPRLLVVQVLTVDRGVDVENKVNARRGKQGHTLIVVDSRVDRVHTNGIDAQLLEQVDVTSTIIGVREGVRSGFEDRRSTWLVIDTLDLRRLLTRKHRSGGDEIYPEWLSSRVEGQVSVRKHDSVDGRNDGGQWGHGCQSSGETHYYRVFLAGYWGGY
jgi:hypothetical protein